MFWLIVLVILCVCVRFVAGFGGVLLLLVAGLFGSCWLFAWLMGLLLVVLLLVVC